MKVEITDDTGVVQVFVGANACKAAKAALERYDKPFLQAKKKEVKNNVKEAE